MSNTYKMQPEDWNYHGLWTKANFSKNHWFCLFSRVKGFLLNSRI